MGNGGGGQVTFRKILVIDHFSAHSKFEFKDLSRKRLKKKKKINMTYTPINFQIFNRRSL